MFMYNSNRDSNFDSVCMNVYNKLVLCSYVRLVVYNYFISSIT